MKKLITICLVCVLSAFVTVLADDVDPPSWRGKGIYAEYDSWTGFPDPEPDLFSYVPPNFCSVGGNLLSEFQGRTNVIEITEASSLAFHDHWDIASIYYPPTYHRIQVTYYPVDIDQHCRIYVNTWGQETIVFIDIDGPSLVDSITAVDGWRTEVWDYSVWVIPYAQEDIFFPVYNDFCVDFSEPEYPAYIDQVVFDGVPEPTTIALLGLGAVILRKRKK